MSQCPKCETELTPRSIAPIEAEECPTCQGLWFEADELRQAKDTVDPDLNWMDFDIWKHQQAFTSKPSPRDCPACRTSMVTLQYDKTGVEVDYCLTCHGLWLDAGEFPSIIGALEQELLTKSFSDYVKASLQEAKELLTGSEPFVSEWKDFATVLRLMQYRLFIENPTLLSAVTSVQKTVQ